MPEYQKKRDKYCKGKCKPCKLRWYIELHLDFNIYFKNLYQGVGNLLFLVIDITKNDIYEPVNTSFITILNSINMGLLN
jgi:hypothetical protein